MRLPLPLCASLLGIVMWLVLVAFVLVMGNIEQDDKEPTTIYEVGKETLEINETWNNRKAFQVKMVAGRRYIIDLISHDFDPYLSLADAIGKTLANDDNSGGGLNARLTFKSPASGTYQVIASSRDNKPGKFRLSIRMEALPDAKQLVTAAKVIDDFPSRIKQVDDEVWKLYRSGKFKEAAEKSAVLLEICRKQYPPERFPDGHPDLANSLETLSTMLLTLGETTKAMTYLQQTLDMARRLYPPKHYPSGHPALAESLSRMGAALSRLGQADKALPLLEESLAMNRKLYPPERFRAGHPDLAINLHSIGAILAMLGEPAKAVPYIQQAMEMDEKLYPAARFPDGHHSVATSLASMGSVLCQVGETEKGMNYLKQALLMTRKLYSPERFPNGHPALVHVLNNTGIMLARLGQADALGYAEEAVAISRRLYPPEQFKEGHADLLGSLHNLAFAQYKLGAPAKALITYEEALEISRKLASREIENASEAQILAHPSVEPARRNFYLTLAEQVAPAQVSYGHLWYSRGGLLLLLQARNRAIVAQLPTSAKIRENYDKLLNVRRKIGRLLQLDLKTIGGNDKELAALDLEQDQLERDLAGSLPTLKRLREMASKGPADLARVLPKNTAFVDLIRYVPGEKGNLRPPRYIAFVLLPGKPEKFVQLGTAQPIDDSVLAWRKSIDEDEDSPAPPRLRELVWDKIAKELPDQTRIIYVCPDGDLARIPFIALPGKKKGTILLEDYTIAIVPSAPWLLDQLLHPANIGTAPERVLAVGDVAYGETVGTAKRRFSSLTATKLELQCVLQTFPEKTREGLSRGAATTAAIRERLANIGYAHFATHAYFDQKSLSIERQRLKAYLDKWSFEAEFPRGASPASRNPTAYVGLVLANVNDPTKAGPDGGILTGLTIQDLPLQTLHLCVLSACETGLGDLTEAEGTLGLQRAFHAAGCPNVIGSLWKVNDRATAALMTQFYHELRQNKRSPLAALREAQLTLYRHPERIPALVGNRGPIDLANTVVLGSGGRTLDSAGRPKTTPVKLWAAFIFSGCGE